MEERMQDDIMWFEFELFKKLSGIPCDHIELSGICTGCRRDLFFSNRMEAATPGVLPPS